MKLYRFRIVPESPWRTPWQSDTLSGLLCWMCARTEGDAVLRRKIIDPGLEGHPPFVLSDAFPGDWLPLPAAVRLADWQPADRKSVKRGKWLSVAAFNRVQEGQRPALSDLIQTPGVHDYTQLRNNIRRVSNTTAHAGGLFPTNESVLGAEVEHLSVYARLRDDFVQFFWQLVKELSDWGFGADRTAGKGQFRLESELEQVEALSGPNQANGCIVLSTFQPAAADPTDGGWEAFTKYGKLGPDFGLENVFKRPIIVLRPGACFLHSSGMPWLGRAIPMRELLAEDVARDLESRGATVVHWAFGLCVPLWWPVSS
jgi:CRISPR-associated protein Csm4